MTGSIPVGSEPGPLAEGLGLLWVLSRGNSTLARIDPERAELPAHGGMGSEPGNLSATDDDVWVIDGCSAGGWSGTLIHVTNAADGDFGLETPLDGAVAQDPEGEVPRTSGEACGIATAGGMTWVATNVPPGLARVDYDPATTETRVVRGVAMTAAPTAITVAKGSVWTVVAAEDVLHRIVPDTGAILRTISVGSDPSALAAGEDALWVVNTGDDTVARVDLESAQVTRSIDVGHRPQGVAVAAGRVWVTVRP